MDQLFRVKMVSTRQDEQGRTYNAGLYFNVEDEKLAKGWVLEGAAVIADDVDPADELVAPLFAAVAAVNEKVAPVSEPAVSAAPWKRRATVASDKVEEGVN